MQTFRESDSESEQKQLRSFSDFDLFSSSDDDESTSLASLAFALVRGRGRGLWHAIIWDGSIDSSSDDDDTLPNSWASGREQSRGQAAPSVARNANLPRLTRVRSRITRTAGSSQPRVGPSS